MEHFGTWAKLFHISNVPYIHGEEGRTKSVGQNGSFKVGSVMILFFTSAVHRMRDQCRSCLQYASYVNQK